MKRILGLSVTVLFAAAVIWVVWKFQPWMPAGHAVHVKTEHLGDCDFEVWQRKNAGLTEPFATGLFARRQNDRWKAFLLDFEDTYRSSVSLRKTDLGVEIFRGNTRLGIFDETQQTYRRELDGASFSGTLLDAEPPDDWWMRQSKN